MAWEKQCSDLSDVSHEESAQHYPADAQQDDDEDHDHDMDVFASGYTSGCMESGNESDPIERYLHVTRWQKRLRNVQLGLDRARGVTAGAGVGSSAYSHGAERGPRRRGIGAVARKLREGPKKVVSTMRERQQNLQQQYQKQMHELKDRLDQGLSKARSSKARQLRHMVCFVCSMCDVVATSVWLGASPWTFHWYYTFKCGGLITVRAMWYRWHGWHYFLFDLCYFSNLALLLYIWVFPSSEVLFKAAFGLSGILLISIPVFRNSFVPHSLDRVTSVQVHIGPALQLWALRWYSNGRPVWWSETCPADALLPTGGPCVFRIPSDFSVLPTLCLYLVWLAGYCFNQFVWNRKVIDSKGYATLYKHMAYDLGILKQLPKMLQGPCASRAVFMAGHFLLFSIGLPCVHVPFLLHTIFICSVTLWAFKNGASFYMTYFWRVYETQIHAFEREMAEASAVSPNAAAQQAPPSLPPTPCSVCTTDASAESVKAMEETTTSPTDADEEDNDMGLPTCAPARQGAPEAMIPSSR